MARRFVLVGLFVLIEQGSLVQVVVGTLFCAVFLTIQLQVAPYRELADNQLALSSSVSLLVFFLCCIVYKVAALTELHALMEEQKTFEN